MSEDVNTLWNRTAEELSTFLNEDTFDRWIAGIIPLELENHTLHLGVSNDVFREWLTNNYTELIQSTFEQVNGFRIKTKFKSGHGHPKTSDNAPPGDDSPSEDHTQQQSKKISNDPPPTSSGAPYNKRFTFDTFVVGENNEFAYTAARAVTKNLGEAYNPLFIHSPTGLGKTHLLQAIAWELHLKHKRPQIVYITSEEFANEFINALRDNALPRFRSRYRNVDLLLIDDVHFFTGKEQLQQEFFHTFNSLFNEHKQIVLTSDRSPHKIGGLEKRLVSRFEWGLTTDILAPDVETRLAILRKKQQDHAVQLDDEILHFIAQGIKANIRHLEGALIRLVSFASMTGQKLSRDKAEQLLKPLLEQENVHAITVETIQKKIADYFNISHADLTSKKRPKNIAEPRQIAMYLARYFTNDSLPSIARYFNRNHGTVMHALSTVEKRTQADSEFARTIEKLKDEIRS